ncbi:T9SS type B sorting domain-containing protein [Marinilabilia rubra]|uniref:Ig-like domain-containing protein n=1 Tax=Marinilabilia rubra TaxID=2162893 RepID=A0A2U2BDR4_9BACT|nr:gliding motility-associated C-terminal domain-containing protein [Marinilabilia rubra]PWE01173.1 hypothetical protein DDZ16_01415 [Marinilabilia rubra]
MIKPKNTYLLLLFLTIPLFSWSQTEPYAELLNADINVCSQTTTSVDLQIRFYGDAPFAYTIKLPDSNEIFEDKSIFSEDLVDGVYYVSYNINFPVENGDQMRTGTFEITEVFDDTNSPWSYGSGNSMTGVSVSLTNWAMPSPNAGSDIDSCGLEATLSAIPDPISSTYSWSVPAQGSISDLQDPNSPYLASQKGSYQLFFTQENGACSTKDTVDIIFRGSPTATISTTSDVCGTAEQEAVLNLSFGGEDGPWDYIISDGGTNTITGTSSTSTTNETTLVSGETTFTYNQVIDTNGCHAKPEDISGEAVVVDLQPNTNAGEDQISCGLSYELQAIPHKGTGIWTVDNPVNVDINAPSEPNSTTTSTGQGTYVFTWTENNQGCENSDQVQIQFIEYSSVNLEVTKETVCQGDEASFPFTATGTNGPWTLTYQTDGSLSTFDFSESSATLTLSPDQTSIYEIVSITDDLGCVANLDNQLEVQVDQMPTPFAGNDTAVCGLQVELNDSTSEVAQSGQWAQADGTFENNDAENPTVVFNSNIWGEQILTWEETNGLCNASDQVTIRFDEPPIADAGADHTLYHQYQTTLRAKAPITSQGEWFGEWYIQGGSGEIADPTQQETLLSGLKHGETVIEWSVTNGACKTPATDTLTLTIKGLTYHTGISPNQDGINDFFKVKGAHTIPNNELIVFDQNGQVVFRRQNLEEGNQWDGRDLDGEPLNNGIYYFIFEGEGIEALKDYIVIKRN